MQFYQTHRPNTADLRHCLEQAGADVSRLDEGRLGEWQRLPPQGRRSGVPFFVMVHRTRPLLATVGDWRTGWCETLAEGHVTFSERAEAQRAAAALRAQARREREQRQAAAALTAQREWATAPAAPDDHPYLVRKGISAHGARARGRDLLIPMHDAGGRIFSRQTISPDGSKRFLAGGRKRAMHWLLGEVQDLLVIAEGFATAASIREATGWPVAVAFDAGNLLPAAEALRARFPAQRFIIAADNDAGTPGNPGVTKGCEAATKARGLCVWPTFRAGDDGSDWNDYARHYGVEALRWTIQEATEERRHG